MVLWFIQEGPQGTSLTPHRGEGRSEPLGLGCYPQTPESIRRAKAARDAERAEITRQTGLVIAEDGHITKRRVNPWLAYGDAIAASVYGKRN